MWGYASVSLMEKTGTYFFSSPCWMLVFLITMISMVIDWTFCFNFLIVCILCDYEFVHTSTGPAEVRGGIRCPGAIIPGSYEPPDLGVRNRASFFCKSSTQSITAQPFPELCFFSSLASKRSNSQDHKFGKESASVSLAAFPCWEVSRRKGALSYLVISAQAHQTVLHEYEIAKTPLFPKPLGMFWQIPLEQSESSQKTNLKQKRREKREPTVPMRVSLYRKWVCTGHHAQWGQLNVSACESSDVPRKWLRGDTCVWPE